MASGDREVTASAWPPGWYPDPWQAGQEGVVRWWDGAGWTSATWERPTTLRRAPWPAGPRTYLSVMAVALCLLLIGPASAADQRCDSATVGSVDGWPGFVVLWLCLVVVAGGTVCGVLVRFRADRDRRRPWAWSSGLVLAASLLVPVGWFLGSLAVVMNCGL